MGRISDMDMDMGRIRDMDKDILVDTQGWGKDRQLGIDGQRQSGQDSQQERTYLSGHAPKRRRRPGTVGKTSQIKNTHRHDGDGNRDTNGDEELDMETGR